jgi:hypothetical protein
MSSPRFTRHQKPSGVRESVAHGRGASFFRHLVQLVGEFFKRLVPLRGLKHCHEADGECREGGGEVFRSDLRQRSSPMDGIPTAYQPLIKVLQARRQRMKDEAS